MSNEENLTNKGEADYVDENVLRAVYALNMCTVSVSQIIEYNDVYILEQEYDGILNNLNLEKMPKADALKNILIELLNTITFFRIQEMRKDDIEKKYQQKMKNAIWSAVPNLNVIVAGGPAAIAYSLATQVGIGYMNYRKEKNNILSEKEKEELELRITALEQFNALRRELFTTAWELAEEYAFDDRLRLTEKQIKQYNQILIDQDEMRKYVRLEAIQDKFDAFPPFWYFFGHTASYIAGNKNIPLEDWEREVYREKAKKHFSKYEELNKFNILREDQMTSSFALEYIDLLLLEENLNSEKIGKLIQVGDEMSGNSLDVKELCAIAYLKIGDTEKAEKILKQLVNESYNTITNAKLLSRIYVSEYLKGGSKTAKFDYKTLVLRVGEENAGYLYPMPEKIVEDEQLQLEYLVEQKILLQMDYRAVINELIQKYTIKFNAVVPAPYGYTSFHEYYGYTRNAFLNRLNDIERILKNTEKGKQYVSELASIGFRFKFVDLLNEVMEICDDLELWKQSENHDEYALAVRKNLIRNKHFLNKLQKKMNSNDFNVEDYEGLQHYLSFKMLMGSMMDDLKDTIMNAIQKMDSMEKVEKAEYNLSIFCKKNKIDLKGNKISNNEYKQEKQTYLDYDILGHDGIEESVRMECKEKMKQLVKSSVPKLIDENNTETKLLILGEDDFNLYFDNSELNADAFRNKTIAIIDDKTRRDCDLVFTYDKLLLIKGNKIKSSDSYSEVNYSNDGNRGEVLKIGKKNEYFNKNVNIGILYRLISELKDDSDKN